MTHYRAPHVQVSAFTCPHCGALAQQRWEHAFGEPTNDQTTKEMVSRSECQVCWSPTIWNRETMIYPQVGTAPEPNEDLPDEVKDDYAEARSIVALSPRGAAALLRLAIQKLCRHFGEPGQRLDDDIASLVKKGLDPSMQKALDAVRLIGNNAVHPGQIDLNDNPELAQALFFLVNEIAAEMISKPKRIAEIYDQLPESDRARIEERDRPSENGTHGQGGGSQA